MMTTRIQFIKHITTLKADTASSGSESCLTWSRKLYVKINLVPHLIQKKCDFDRCQLFKRLRAITDDSRTEAVKSGRFVLVLTKGSK